MLTPNQIEQFKIDAQLAKKIKGFIRELSKLLPGLSSGNISDYLSGRISPSEKVYEAFYSLYKPPIKEQNGFKPEADRIDRLIAIMESQADSIARLSRAHEVLAEKVGLDESASTFSLGLKSREEKRRGEGGTNSGGKSKNNS